MECGPEKARLIGLIVRIYPSNQYQTAEGQIRQLVDKWDESIGPQMGQM